MSDDDKKDYLKQLWEHRRLLGANLRILLRVGYASSGHLLIQIEDTRAEIARIKQTLRDWNVPVDDHPDDDERSFPSAIMSGLDMNAADRQRLSTSIQVQRQAAGDGQLYEALSSLNYISQKLRFADLVNKQNVAAILIDGQDKYGQQWLLNLFLKQYESSINALSIDLRRFGRGTSIADLCREIGHKANVAVRTPEELAKILCGWWQTQHTILIFHSVERAGEQYIRELLTDFWAPIAAHACEPSRNNGNNKLLLFLVDKKGMTSSWNLPSAQNPTDDAALLRRLPPISRFSEDELNIWRGMWILKLPNFALTDVPTILENTDDGVPESVLEEICALCDYHWNDGVGRWMKY